MAGLRAATIAVCAHVAVEISLVHVLEDEHQFVLGVDDIVQETIFSCFNSFIRETSRVAVLGVPSSKSRWIFLRATSSPVW